MFHFLEIDITEQKKYEMEHRYLWIIQYMNDLRYEIKFESCVKDKNSFSVKRNIAFLS